MYSDNLPTDPLVNPCITCGACCAFFRASFYWAEADDVTPGGVPVLLTDDLKPFRRVMRGTNCMTPRCVALMGEIGKEVRCTIYANRASICKDFDPAWIEGVPNERCDRARAKHGLAALTPETWWRKPPRAA